MNSKEWLEVIKSRDYPKAELEKMVASNKAVIEAFYNALRELGLMPEGIFGWNERDAKRFAEGIRERAMKSIGSKGGQEGWSCPSC